MDQENCVVLWRNVIRQALYDATMKLRHDELHHADIAVDWLLNDDDDFYDVCFMAGIDPDVLRAKAREVIDESS